MTNFHNQFKAISERPCYGRPVVDTRPETPPAAASDRWNGAQRAYAVALFALAVGVLAFVLARGDARPLAVVGIAPALFFLAYGLFTISIGYEHPNLGYYSFDRVAQVASILVLGPVDAALINGFASFVYPWHRLWKGVPVRHVAYAALNNSGLMALIVLIAGSMYVALDGPVPLSLTGWSIVLLIVLVLGMQLLNDAGMLGLLALGRRDLSGFFNAFPYALELGSGATAVLVALVYTNMQTTAFALLLAVLTVGMLALRQFADMRHKLELIVEERTQPPTNSRARAPGDARQSDGVVQPALRGRLPRAGARDLQTTSSSLHDRLGRHRLVQAGQRSALARDRRCGPAARRGDPARTLPQDGRHCALRRRGVPDLLPAYRGARSSNAMRGAAGRRGRAGRSSGLRSASR